MKEAQPYITDTGLTGYNVNPDNSQVGRSFCDTPHLLPSIDALTAKLTLKKDTSTTLPDVATANIHTTDKSPSVTTSTVTEITCTNDTLQHVRTSSVQTPSANVSRVLEPQEITQPVKDTTSSKSITPSVQPNSVKTTTVNSNSDWHYDIKIHHSSVAIMNQNGSYNIVTTTKRVNTVMQRGNHQVLKFGINTGSYDSVQTTKRELILMTAWDNIYDSVEVTLT